MSDIELLQLEALEACTFRGHTMGVWRKHDFYRDTVVYACCVHCNMQVVVNVKSAPNDISIGGKAVALTCCDTEE